VLELTKVLVYLYSPGMRTAILLASAFWCLTACGEVIEGRVVAVADGDTPTVLDLENEQHKIRLAGIDAPEKAQPFGNVSKQHLSALVFGKTVTVEFVPCT
jgi:endonuclease YncB( thermonuclease family)